MDEQTLQEFWKRIETSFRPERAAGLDAEIEIDLDGSAQYTLLIRDQKISGHAGKAEKPRLVLRATEKDLLDIFQGRLDPGTAYFRGRLSVEGDMSLAMKLVSFFQR
jgi:putative sterol carrier protein